MDVSDRRFHTYSVTRRRKHESAITYVDSLSKASTGNVAEFSTSGIVFFSLRPGVLIYILALDGRLVRWNIANLNLDMSKLRI